MIGSFASGKKRAAKQNCRMHSWGGESDSRTMRSSRKSNMVQQAKPPVVAGCCRFPARPALCLIRYRHTSQRIVFPAPIEPQYTLIGSRRSVAPNSCEPFDVVSYNKPPTKAPSPVRGVFIPHWSEFVLKRDLACRPVCRSHSTTACRHDLVASCCKRGFFLANHLRRGYFPPLSQMPG